MRDVEQLWKAGFALGASLENTVAIGEDRVINPEGCASPTSSSATSPSTPSATSRWPAPAPGSYRSYCGGHRLNCRRLEALFADRANYAIVEAGTRRETRLRGLRDGGSPFAAVRCADAS